MWLAIAVCLRPSPAVVLVRVRLLEALLLNRVLPRPFERGGIRGERPARRCHTAPELAALRFQ